ncbi:MAG: DUF4124 domain-containing protein [Gammaproteobacteria bacterium]|nr:MAG: DUF4124 domain-containing protein [Gammaproteobacteria bacterium]
MRAIWFICLLLGSSLVYAEMYKWVDKQGKTHFSDKPPAEGAEVYVPPPIPTVKSTPPLPMKNEMANAKKANDKMYESLAITSPQNDETFFSDRPNVVVSVKPTPELNATESHQVVIRVNGEVVQKGTQTSYTMRNPVRGAYTVSADISDADGKVLITSGKVTFNVRRHHL